MSQMSQELRELTMGANSLHEVQGIIRDLRYTINTSDDVQEENKKYLTELEAAYNKTIV